MSSIEPAPPTPAPAPKPTTTPDPFWNQVDRLFRELQRSFDPGNWVVEGPAGTSPFATGHVPAATDILDLGESYEIRSELPGVPKEQVEVRVAGDTVQITAELPAAKTENGPNYLRQERTWTGFSRQIVLPEAVRADGISARSEHGILTVTLPKANPIVEHRVKVE